MEHSDRGKKLLGFFSFPSLLSPPLPSACPLSSPSLLSPLLPSSFPLFSPLLPLSFLFSLFLHLSNSTREKCKTWTSIGQINKGHTSRIYLFCPSNKPCNIDPFLCCLFVFPILLVNKHMVTAGNNLVFQPASDFEI